MTISKPSSPCLSSVRGVHHSAFRCRDAAQTRDFYEGVLGMPLAGAFRIVDSPVDGQPLEYIHIFFRYADGNMLGFFDMPHDAKAAHFEQKSAFDVHIAFEVADEAEQQRLAQRIADAGFPVIGPMDHHFCKSIYTIDPNGLPIEFTHRVPDHDAMFAQALSETDDLLDRWSATKRAATAA